MRGISLRYDRRDTEGTGGPAIAGTAQRIDVPDYGTSPSGHGGLHQGQTMVPFTGPAKTGVISVRRQDAGAVTVGWEVS